MKAILVIDMPKCCAECPLMLWDAESEYYGACCPTLKEVNCVADSYIENENKGTIPNWCPLKPIPDKAGERLIEGLDRLEEIKNNVRVSYVNDLMGETE